MIGILAEKPSAARNFAKALGGMSGTYNGEKYVITASHGHLYEFADPCDNVCGALSNQYKSWDIANLPWNERDFIWKKMLKPGAAGTVKQIESVLSKCDEITIATDNDPTGEGELLAWEILDALKLYPKKWSRMYFEDESAPEVQKAFRERKIIPSMEEDPDYIKALYRSKWDYLSMQFTRIATKFGDGRSVLRQGRLKSAMVLITGDGLKALNNYEKVPFYQNRFRDENGNMYTNQEEPQYKNREEVPAVYHSSSVVIDSKEIKHSAPPKLLDLAGLSAILAGYGVRAEQVLSTYQAMYEDQIVSYPRTEDKVVTPEQFNELLPKIDRIAAVVGVDKSLLTHRQPRPTHVKSGGAHGANRPGPNVPSSLEELKKYGACAPMIYTVLARNYLTMLGEDYEYEQQKGHLADYPSFKGIANIPKKLGFKAIFSDNDKPQDTEEENTKNLGTIAEPFIFEGFPPKPPTPTTKWLMKQLEKYDVGTGATRTSIYADVTDETAKYPLIKETKGKLSMTPYGEMSYALLPGTHIGDLKMTEQLMMDMRNIASGNANPDECLANVRNLVLDDLEVMKKNGAALKNAMPSVPTAGTIASLGKCPNCGGNVMTGKFGPYCQNKCGITLGKAYGKTLNETQLRALLSGKKVLVKGLVSKKTGSPYSAYLIPDGVEEYTWNGKSGKQMKFKMEFPDRS